MRVIRVPRLVLVALALATLVVALAAGVSIYVNRLAATPRGMQIILATDARQPGHVTIVVSVVEALPFWRDHRDEAMTCNGVRLQYGQAPLSTAVGFFGTVPSDAANAAYRCTFQSWRGVSAFAIPTVTTDVTAILFPASGARLALAQPLQVAYDPGKLSSEGGLANGLLLDIQASDNYGHSAQPTSSGVGPTGGSIAFAPLARQGFQSGPGAITLARVSRTSLPVAGWHPAAVIYHSGVSLPVFWM